MMFSMIYFVMLETERYGKLRSVFDSRPWRNRENAYLPASSASPVSGAANRCPFSKKLARGVCPICCSCTSKDGFHHGDPKRLHDTVGIAMIEYDMARKAAEGSESPLTARVHLDTLVSYRGNYLFGTISPSCKGCFIKTWCWNVAYRMTWQSSILAFNAMLCTFIFYADISIFYADLKNMLLCISAFFSVSTLCVQITILATAVVFIIEHPFMDDDALPKLLMVRNKLVMKWIHYFALPSAKFGVPATRKYWSWLTKTDEKQQK